MTDKELLELAARAAGICPVLCYEANRNCLRIGDREHYSLWRPLTDPGDALRLAVQLEMYVNVDTSDVFACAKDGAVMREFKGTDPLAATMRAITRAAAEIGRRMPE